MDKYLVVGNPINHSKSPIIHQAFAEQTGQAMMYEKLLAPENEFKQTLKQLVDNKVCGLNVTVPFKIDAFNAVNELSDRAQAAGAVNTILIRSDGSTWGDNTDGIGMVNDIELNHKRSLHGQRILLLGAGGAVRGVLQPLLAAQPKEIIICNRTAEKALRLAADFNQEIGSGSTNGGSQTRLTGISYSQCPTQAFDWIINGTSASLSGEVPPVPRPCVDANTCCYDMLYGNTVFLQWAKQNGAALAIDGLGMLVEQAAESFRLWRGVRPQTQTVIDALNQSVSSP